MLSPTRDGFQSNDDRITLSLKKTIHRKSIHDALARVDSDSSDEDGGERGSFRVQRVRAKETRDGSLEDSPVFAPRAPRDFRVFPELPSSPQRAKNRVTKSHQAGIMGLCAPANVPPKIVTIQDYSFSSPNFTVFAGQTILFSLSSDVPLHVEHVLEGSCEENAELCFVSPLLQCPYNTTFMFTPLCAGYIHVSCQVYPEMECEVSILSPESFRRVSTALSTSSSVLLASPLQRASLLQSSGVVSLRRLNAESVSETLTQSSFFDSDDELSDQYSMHSTPRRQQRTDGLAFGEAPSLLAPTEEAKDEVTSSENEDLHSTGLFPGNLFKRYNAPVRQFSDDDGVAFKISVEDFIFRPDAVFVEQGSMVQFSYHGNISIQKLSCDGEFDNVALGGDAAAIFVHAFNYPGIFTVKNEVFSFMSCRITVSKRGITRENTDSIVRGGMDNDQNSQNIYNGNSRNLLGEQEYMDSKVLRNSFFKNLDKVKAISLNLERSVIASSSSSDCDDSADGGFVSSSLRSFITSQLDQTHIKDTQLFMSIDSIKVGSQPSSETAVGQQQSLENEGIEKLSSVTSPVSCPPKLCGSFLFSGQSKVNDKSQPLVDLGGIDDVTFPADGLTLAISTSSKRRQRRKQIQAAIRKDIPSEQLSSQKNRPNDVALRVDSEPIEVQGITDEIHIQVGRDSVQVPSSKFSESTDTYYQHPSVPSGLANEGVIATNESATEQYNKATALMQSNRETIQSYTKTKSVSNKPKHNKRRVLKTIVSLPAVELTYNGLLPNSDPSVGAQSEVEMSVTNNSADYLSNSSTLQPPLEQEGDIKSTIGPDTFLMKKLVAASQRKQSKTNVTAELRNAPTTGIFCADSFANFEEYFMSRYRAVEAIIANGVVRSGEIICRYEVDENYRSSFGPLPAFKKPTKVTQKNIRNTSIEVSKVTHHRKGRKRWHPLLSGSTTAQI